MPDQSPIFVQIAPSPNPPLDVAVPAAWIWLLIGYGVLIAVLATYATHIALSSRNKQQRADAYKVLKLVWTTGTGATGLIGLILRITQTGLL